MAELEETSQSQGEEGVEEDEGPSEFLPGYPTFEDYSKALLSQVMQATRSANSLPTEGDDFDYYSSFQGFKTFCSKMGDRANRSIGRLIRHQQLPCHWPQSGGLPPSSLALEESFEALVEANDLLLERVGVLLDEASGVKKNEQPVLPAVVQQGTAEVASWNKKRDAVRESVGSFKFIHAKNVQRPQLKFQDHMDNSNTPFIPPIRYKPHALKPLPEVFQKLHNPVSLNALIANAKEWATSDERFAHPYQYELDHFEPTEEQLELKEPQLPGNLEDTPLTYIDSLEQLQELQQKLMSVKEFAVDLEHHSYRSFQGFVCLMQVSTRDHDYLVDVLELRHHIHLLLDPFTNPKIVKATPLAVVEKNREKAWDQNYAKLHHGPEMVDSVMHGADMDIQWLQRDFGIYVVNLFDTGQASRVLGLPRYSLAFLLQYCCDVQAEKQYQLADWRIRPLPPELIKYAREDTHYLLYIYDRMRNELIRRGNKQNNFLHSVLDRSRDVSLIQYQKLLFSENDYLKLYHKHKKMFNSQQLHCLRLLFAWRDRTAREEDESVGFVLPSHMLFQISEILPREPQGVLACCNPIPTLVRQRLNEVYLLVQQARETPPSDKLPVLTPTSTSSSSAQPFQSSTPTRLPSTHMTTPTHLEETDSPSKSTTVRITGPPIKHAKPVLSAFEGNTQEFPITETVKKKVEEIRRSLPDIFSKFLKPVPMAPSEVILQHRLSDAFGRSIPGTPVTTPQAPTPTHTPHTPTTGTATPTNAQDGGDGSRSRDKKRKWTVREMGETKEKERPRSSPDTQKEEEEVAPKRPRLNRKDFKPFDYAGSKFTEFTKDSSTTRQFYDPHVEGGRLTPGQPTASGPRSRVMQKSAERSQTFTHGGRVSKHLSWPGTHK